MNRREFIWICIIVLGFGVMYIESSYSSLFETRNQFIYHPKTDTLYAIEVARFPDYRQKWKVFIPFASKIYFYRNIDCVNNLGSLSKLDHEIDRRKKLMRENPKEALAEEKREFDKFFEETDNQKWFEEQLKEADSWELQDAMLSIRSDVDAKQLIPASWKPVLNELEEYRRKYMVADFIISTNKLDNNTPYTRRPKGTEFLRNVLMLDYRPSAILARKRGYEFHC